MFFVLKIESFGHVFKMLEQRENPHLGTIVWTVIILLAIPLILVLLNLLRSRIRRQRNLDRSYGHLEKLGGEKDLTYPEQMTAERLVKSAGLKNPAQVLTSIERFDQAVAAWMPRVQKMPWLEMEEQLERLGSLREKLGFRYLPSGRPPSTTRELVLGQKLYMLAGGRKGLRLLSAPIANVDDLAIYTGLFKTRNQIVKIRKQHEVWAFFWPEGGGEYRYKTQALKEVERPAPYLMLQHGDTLIHHPDREVFSCRLDLEAVAEWLPASKIGRTTPTPAVFQKKEEEAESLSIHLHELSGSGFVLVTDATIEIDDLIRLRSSGGVPQILDEKVGRAVKKTRSGVRFKFLTLSPEDREAILKHIAPRISAKALKKRMGRKSSTST